MLKTIELPFRSLHLRTSDIYLALGYGGLCPPPDVQQMVQDMINTISKICEPSYCYIIKENIKLGQKSINVDGIDFTTGKIIASYIEKAESIAFFIATAGCKFEEWLEKLHNDGDIWLMFLADAIGSEIAEATARAAADDLEQISQCQQQRTSNSYSPGYCGWAVKEQQKLFSLFPPKPCGVQLTDSSLMLPIKSVSGIIAVGSEIEKEAYGCEICTMRSCYKKRSSEN